MPCFRSGFSGRQGAGSSFPLPDEIINSTFGGVTWAGWTNGSSGDPSGGNLTKTNSDHAPIAGATGMATRTWAASGGDVAAQFFYDYSAGRDKVWFRFYFKINNTINTVQKLFRFYSPARTSPIGGIYISDALSVNCDLENTAAQTAILLDSGSNIFDNNWHYVEGLYWRNNHPSGFPVWQFWYDGSPAFFPNGPPTHNSDGDPHHWLWKTSDGTDGFNVGDHYLSAGERNSILQLGANEALAVINGGVVTAGVEGMDWIGVSTLGRIGP